MTKTREPARMRVPPLLLCPTCRQRVDTITHDPGYSSYLPHQGTYVIEGGDPWPRDAQRYDAEIKPMPDLDVWTLGPCGHRFRKVAIEYDENNQPTSLTAEWQI